MKDPGKIHGKVRVSEERRWLGWYTGLKDDEGDLGITLTRTNYERSPRFPVDVQDALIDEMVRRLNSPARVTKAELQHRYDVLLDVAAHWLAGSGGVVVKKDFLFEGDTKLSTLIGTDRKRLRFTDEDVADIMEVLDKWVEHKLREGK